MGQFVLFLIYHVHAKPMMKPYSQVFYITPLRVVIILKSNMNDMEALKFCLKRFYSHSPTQPHKLSTKLFKWLNCKYLFPIINIYTSILQMAYLYHKVNLNTQTHKNKNNFTYWLFQHDYKLMYQIYLLMKQYIF